MSLKLACLISAFFLVPALAQAEEPKNPAIAELFAHDPGNSAAQACFSRHFDDAWMAAHPEQNIRDLTVFAGRREGENPWQDANMLISFNDSKKLYEVTASCGEPDGNVFSCGVDCDGGGFEMTVVSKDEIAIGRYDGLRYYDSDSETPAEKTAGFKSGDANITLARTDIKNCLPLVYDEELKAKLTAGTQTQ